MKSTSDSSIWLRETSPGRRWLRPRRLLLVTDTASLCLAVGAMYVNLVVREAGRAQKGITLLTGGLMLVLAVALLLRARQYSIGRRMSLAADVGILIRDTAIAAALIMLLSYLTKGFFTGLTTPSRIAIGVTLAAFLAFGAISRLALTTFQRHQYQAGRGVRKVIVAGDGRAASEVLELMEGNPTLGVVPIGRLQYGAHIGGVEFGAAASSLPVVDLTDSLKGLERLHQALRSWQVNEVIVALDPEEQTKLPGLVNLLTLAHVPFKVVPSLFEDTYRVTKLLGHPEIPVIDVNVGALDRVNRILKRTTDIFVAAVGLIVTAPIQLAAIGAIASETGLPVFFKQQRVGKNGRHFTIYKYRTMIKDADEKLAELRAENESGDSRGRLFKMRQDPRITRVGSLLRRFSLDELPQFVNVLKGEMSVVGPRPPLPAEVQQYEREHLYRLRALPGITGLWQVSGRSDLSFEDLVRLDRYYLDNWSLGLDAKIMLRTLAAMVSRKGAY